MKKEQPKYLSLYEEIREAIVNGSFPYGSKIPSKRLMAQEKGLSLISVEHAYELLNEEGYIEARMRSGYYVIYRENDLIHVEKTKAVNEKKTQTGEYVFPVSVYMSAVRGVLAEKGDQLLVRTEGRGSQEIRSAIASYLNRSRGMRVKPDQVVIGSGSEYLYSLIVQLLGRDRLYAVEDPCYDNIIRMYEHNDVKTDYLKLGANGIRSDELSRTKASVLHVTPYHSYPSGRSTDASKRMEYIRWAEKHNAFIVEDDYESEFSPLLKVQQTLFSIEPVKHVIYLNTFTRTIAPSIRVGYMILPEAYTEEFLEKMSSSSCTVSALSQYVIARLLNDGSFERHINRVRRKLRRNMQYETE
jgi:GntR family transcriptional regulator/MocR family aminotransferase